MVRYASGYSPQVVRRSLVPERSRGTPQVVRPDRVLRIGVVDYLNAYPLWAALETDASGLQVESKIQLVRGVPSFLAGELRAGHVDAALISSVEYLREPAEFDYHSALCIAAARESYSIRLFVPEVKQPFAAAIQSLRRIYTDISSRSSVAQLTVILQQLGAQVQQEEVNNADERIQTLRAGEALLSIGDTALKNMHKPSFDLQQEYYQLFNRGFVYALWVFRQDLKKEIEPILTAAYAAYKADISGYQSQAIKRFKFETEFTRKYLGEIIHHELTPEHHADLDFFAQRLKSSKNI